MVEVSERTEQSPLVVRTLPAMEMDDAEFFEFCRLNPDLRIERSSDGRLILMAPAGGSSSRGNSELIYLFQQWAHRDGTGQVFDSSGGFNLPNGATRSPDVSWVKNERLDQLTAEQWEKFVPLCPDFVVELRSPSDPLRLVKEKLEEYIENGARLGWLLDPVNKRVYIYRPGRPPEVLDNPDRVSGDPVLKGFILEVPRIWAAMEHKK